MNLRWRVLTVEQVRERKRNGYFEFTDSWRSPDWPTQAVLEYLDGPSGTWVEVPFHDP